MFKDNILTQYSLYTITIAVIIIQYFGFLFIQSKQCCNYSAIKKNSIRDVYHTILHITSH